MKPNLVVTRNNLISILTKWQSGMMSVEDVVKWAESYSSEIEFVDWEGDDDQSISNEVMRSLDSIGMNLVIKEDIPIYLEFLNTPEGEFEKGYSSWNNALGKIDYTSRQQLLKEHPVYTVFCK